MAHDNEAPRDRAQVASWPVWGLWHLVALLALLLAGVPRGGGDGELSVFALGIGFAVWLVAWLIPRGRLRGAVLVASVLTGPLIVFAYH